MLSLKSETASSWCRHQVTLAVLYVDRVSFESQCKKLRILCIYLYLPWLTTISWETCHYLSKTHTCGTDMGIWWIGVRICVWLIQPTTLSTNIPHLSVVAAAFTAISALTTVNASATTNVSAIANSSAANGIANADATAARIKKYKSNMDKNWERKRW